MNKSDTIFVVETNKTLETFKIIFVSVCLLHYICAHE